MGLVFVLMGIVEAVVNGLVLRILWGWFVVPLFHLPALTIPYAIGLTYVVDILRPVPGPNFKDEDWEEVFRYCVLMMVNGPLLILVLGWIIHFFL